MAHTFTSPHSGSLHMIYKKLPNPDSSSLIAEELVHMHCNHYPGLRPARLTRLLVCLESCCCRLRCISFFVLTPPSPSTLHFLFQIFFNFSCLPFSFEHTKKPLLSLALVPTPRLRDKCCSIMRNRDAQCNSGE